MLFKFFLLGIVWSLLVLFSGFMWQSGLDLGLLFDNWLMQNLTLSHAIVSHLD